MCLVTKDVLFCSHACCIPHVRAHTHTRNTHHMHAILCSPSQEELSSSSDESEDDAMEVDHSKLHQKKGTKHDFIRSEEVCSCLLCKLIKQSISQLTPSLAGVSFKAV